MHDAGHTYQITNILSSGLYFLKDKYRHQFKRPIPPNHLVRYYGVRGFCKSDVKVENCQSDSSDMETGISYQSDDNSNVSQNSSSEMNGCQRTRIHKIDENKNCDSDSISQSQIMIMQSNDSPFSSDESVLKVCSVNDNNNDDDYDDDDNNNPWGDIQNILLNIKYEQTDTTSDISSINSSSSSSSPTVTVVEKGPIVIFSPLSNIECLNTAKEFYINCDHQIMLYHIEA